jgi:hypothetical protein
MIKTTKDSGKQYEYNYIDYRKRFTNKTLVEGLQELADDKKMSPQELCTLYIQDGVRIDLEKKEIRKRKQR